MTKVDAFVRWVVATMNAAPGTLPRPPGVSVCAAAETLSYMRPNALHEPLTAACEGYCLDASL